MVNSSRGHCRFLKNLLDGIEATHLHLLGDALTCFYRGLQSFYGGFYHGVKLVARQPKIFVRTLDWKTRTVEVEVEGGAKETRVLKDAKLWSDAEPNLTTIEVAGRKVRFDAGEADPRDGAHELQSSLRHHLPPLRARRRNSKAR